MYVCGSYLQIAFGIWGSNRDNPQGNAENNQFLEFVQAVNGLKGAA